MVHSEFNVETFSLKYCFIAVSERLKTEKTNFPKNITLTDDFACYHLLTELL